VKNQTKRNAAQEVRTCIWNHSWWITNFEFGAKTRCGGKEENHAKVANSETGGAILSTSLKKEGGEPKPVCLDGIPWDVSSRTNNTGKKEEIQTGE